MFGGGGFSLLLVESNGNNDDTLGLCVRSVRPQPGGEDGQRGAAQPDRPERLSPQRAHLPLPQPRAGHTGAHRRLQGDEGYENIFSTIFLVLLKWRPFFSISMYLLCYCHWKDATLKSVSTLDSWRHQGQLRLVAWPSWQCHVLSQHCTINYAAAGSRKWSIGRSDHSPVLSWSADDGWNGWWRYVLCLQAFRFPSTPTVNFVATVQFCQVTRDTYLFSF